MSLCDTWLILVGHPPLPRAFYSILLILFCLRPQMHTVNFLLSSLKSIVCRRVSLCSCESKNVEKLGIFRKEEEDGQGCSLFCLAETWHTELGTVSWHTILYSRQYYEVEVMICLASIGVAIRPFCPPPFFLSFTHICIRFTRFIFILSFFIQTKFHYLAFLPFLSEEKKMTREGKKDREDSTEKWGAE
ncbi:MAG: hypothetical protein JOS17DRAFT_395256 [Linnemannia elongata]|nr:MAG: hypothetical protein JOS17DRAFT_395256 [Linnemannia elongata]